MSELTMQFEENKAANGGLHFFKILIFFWESQRGNFHAIF